MMFVRLDRAHETVKTVMGSPMTLLCCANILQITAQADDSGLVDELARLEGAVMGMSVTYSRSRTGMQWNSLQHS